MKVIRMLILPYIYIFHSYDGQLMRQVATMAVKFDSLKLAAYDEHLLQEFGWQDVSMEGVRGLSNAKVKEMLECIAWRKTWEDWGWKMEVKPKLIMIKKVTDLEEWADCAGVRRRADRMMMSKLRGGTAASQI